MHRENIGALRIIQEVADQLYQWPTSCCPSKWLTISRMVEVLHM
ncbi:hypothetical protein CsSME_00008197 [Camellia sinensis var. sinensis]